MRKLLLAAGFVLALASPLSPAQAQPLVTVSCSSVFIDFRTSIQPDSATVQIDSNAGTETHSVTLVQGGTDTVTFPLDGQSGESVTVTVTLVYKGQPNVVSSTAVLADCPTPSPSPTAPAVVPPSVAPSTTSPSLAPPTASPSLAPPTVEPVPEPTEEAVVGEVVTRTEDVSEVAPELPAELAYTGTTWLWLLLLAAGFLGFGWLLREKSNSETEQEPEHLWEYLGDEVEPIGPPHTHPRSER